MALCCLGEDAEVTGRTWGPGQGEALGVSLLINKSQSSFSIRIL